MGDTEQNVRLHLGDEHPLGSPARVLGTSAFPPTPIRELQRAAARVGLLSWQRRWLAPLERERGRAGLPKGPPRFLVRVDEFPCATSLDDPERYGLNAARRFHEVMRETGVRHLMAVVPQMTRSPLDPDARGGRPLGDDELAHLERMRADGVTFAQHGTTHRTRQANPHRHSELVGLSLPDTEALLDHGRSLLRDHGIETRIFVPPFNSFQASQWPVLAQRYDVVCGGPESIRYIGWHGGPLWRGSAAYLPCYPPLYGRARDMIAPAAEMIEQAPGTWIPIVLHLAWEADDNFLGLRRLAERLAPCSVDWDSFLEELDRSRLTR